MLSFNKCYAKITGFLHPPSDFNVKIGEEDALKKFSKPQMPLKEKESVLNKIFISLCKVCDFYPTE